MEKLGRHSTLRSMKQIAMVIIRIIIIIIIIMIIMIIMIMIILIHYKPIHRISLKKKIVDFNVF